MRIIKVDESAPAPEAIRTAVEALRRGQLVIFPTETVYGLAADAMNEEAVKRVFTAKRRDEGHPLPVQISGVEMLDQVAASVPEPARKLAEKHWPGPLTLILPKSSRIPEIVTGGLDTIGVRVPDHAVALALLREFGGPIVATSANISGQGPATSAGEAVRDLGDAVAVVLDSGECKLGVASTVVDAGAEPIRILREGAIELDSRQSPVDS